MKAVFSRMNVKVCLAFFMIFLFLPACYRIVKKDAGFELKKSPPAVRRFLSILEQRNSAVTSFKGIGKIRVWDSQSSRTSRAAWLASADGRLRIEFLGLPGQPVASFIFNGIRYSFFSQIDHQAYGQNCEDPDLKPVTGVSIKTSEVIEYLAGGIPIYEYDSVSLNESASGDRHVLIFKKNWLGRVEKIVFKGLALEKVEIFRWGKKVYQSAFKNVKTINGHLIPFYVAITNGDDQGFSFSVDRHWPDIHVSPSTFAIPLEE